MRVFAILSDSSWYVFTKTRRGKIFSSGISNLYC